jgi:hypothetical protein
LRSGPPAWPGGLLLLAVVAVLYAIARRDARERPAA